MSLALPTRGISHWNYLARGLEIYSQIEKNIDQEKLSSTTLDRVNVAEGGFFSSKREYLQIRRNEFVFHCCAAPFGSGFFVSWWLGELESGFRKWLCQLPYVGKVLNIFFNRVLAPMTMYKLDTAQMFQSAAHGAIMRAVDEALTKQGLTTLSDSERKPIMKEFFA